MSTTGLEKSKRIIMRLREKNGDIIIESQLRKAIMLECGTDERTIQKYNQLLRELKWIKRICRNKYELDTKDIVCETF